MPNKNLSMNKICQVLRCYASVKGTKSISNYLSVSRNTIKKYLQIYHKSELSIDKILAMNDSELYTLLQEKEEPLVHSERYETLQSLFPSYCKRLKKKGVSRFQLHQEYISQHPDGYVRSTFGLFIQKYLEISRPIMHL